MVEYEESLVLDSAGTVNVYSVGVIVTVVAEAINSTLVETVVVKVVVIASNVTCVLIPSVTISVTNDGTSTIELILSVSSKGEVVPVWLS